MFKFIVPEILPCSFFPYSFSLPTSSIRIEFQTSNAGCGADALFLDDLGSGVATGGDLPCYGMDGIKGKLLKTLYFDIIFA